MMKAEVKGSGMQAIVLEWIAREAKEKNKQTKKKNKKSKKKKKKRKQISRYRKNSDSQTI